MKKKERMCKREKRTGVILASTYVVAQEQRWTSVQKLNILQVFHPDRYISKSIDEHVNNWIKTNAF